MPKVLATQGIAWATSEGARRSIAMTNQYLSDDRIFEYGRAAGSNAQGWAGQCPFMQPAQAAQKAVWLKGFSAGRIAGNVYQFTARSAPQEQSDLSTQDAKG